MRHVRISAIVTIHSGLSRSPVRNDRDPPQPTGRRRHGHADRQPFTPRIHGTSGSGVGDALGVSSEPRCGRPLVVAEVTSQIPAGGCATCSATSGIGRSPGWQPPWTGSLNARRLCLRRSSCCRGRPQPTRRQGAALARPRPQGAIPSWCHGMGRSEPAGGRLSPVSHHLAPRTHGRASESGVGDPPRSEMRALPGRANACLLEFGSYCIGAYTYGGRTSQRSHRMNPTRV
jgi:hypothetical protein